MSVGRPRMSALIREKEKGTETAGSLGGYVVRIEFYIGDHIVQLEHEEIVGTMRSKSKTL